MTQDSDQKISLSFNPAQCGSKPRLAWIFGNLAHVASIQPSSVGLNRDSTILSSKGELKIKNKMNPATQLRNAHRKNDIETIVELCADPSIDEIEPSLRHRVLFWALAYHLNKRKREGTVCVALGGEKCPEHDCKKLDEIAGKIIIAVKTIEHFDPSLDDDVKSNLSNMYVLAWRLYTCEWFQVLYKNWPGATWSHRLAYTHQDRCLTIARGGTVMAQTILLPENLPCPKTIQPMPASLTS